MAELAAIKANRHTLAIALFSGIQLIHAQSRILPSDSGRSERSALAFVDRVLAGFPAPRVVFEKALQQTQSAKLAGQIAEYLRSTGRTVSFIDRQSVIASFSHPAVRKRHEVRKIIREIWPVFDVGNRSPLSLDAAALGLYVQVERLLTDH